MKTYIITLAVLFLSISSLLGQQNDITPKKRKYLTKESFLFIGGGIGQVFQSQTFDLKAIIMILRYKV